MTVIPHNLVILNSNNPPVTVSAKLHTYEDPKLNELQREDEAEKERATPPPEGLEEQSYESIHHLGADS